MLHQRLKKRVHSAIPIGKGRLSKHHLAWHKISTDGSGKCDIVEDPEQNSYVWGVLYDINPAEKIDLDKAEGLGQGYDEKSVTVQCEATNVLATTYYATNINSALSPYHWYKHYVVSGAKENELPDDYIHQLVSTPSIEDPDYKRRERNKCP